MSRLSLVHVLQVLEVYSRLCVDTFGKAKYWTILATGSDELLQRWAMACWPDFFDRRKQTARCRVWCLPDEPIEEPMLRIVEAADKYDVTIQLLCTHGPDETSREIAKLGGVFASVADMRETYPVVYLGSHGQKWGDA